MHSVYLLYCKVVSEIPFEVRMQYTLKLTHSNPISSWHSTNFGHSHQLKEKTWVKLSRPSSGDWETVTSDTSSIRKPLCGNFLIYVSTPRVCVYFIYFLLYFYLFHIQGIPHQKSQFIFISLYTPYLISSDVSKSFWYYKTLEIFHCIWYDNNFRRLDV